MKDVAQELESLLTSASRLQQINEETAARKPAPGKWSKKETLGHLIDSAANHHQRLVRIQLQGTLDLPGYDGDEWVRVQRYQNLPWSEIIELWRMYNRHLAQIIRNVDADALKHTWKAPEGQTVDLEFIMRDYVVHMKHHLDQI